MARARNIKPSFFKNEVLVEMGPFDRLLFIGLWCLADREGRVEDRPKRIKMELFPCDSYDVEQGLADLERNGFVKRYEAAGVRVLSIVNFLKHQTPHGTEKDSELPDENGSLTVYERGNNGYVTGRKRKNNVNLDQNNVAPPLDDSAPPVKTQGANTLNPDSLNPDSLEANASLSASQTTEQPQAGQDPIFDDSADPESEGATAKAIPPCPVDRLIEAYESNLPTLPSVRRSLFKAGKNVEVMRARWKWVMTSKHERGQRAGQRLATTVEEGVDWFDRYFAYVAESPFLTGSNDKWKADLAWLMTASKFEAVLSNKYHQEVAA